MKLPYFLIIVTTICILFQVPTIQQFSYWDSALIQQGEWWRIVSGNFAHTNIIHLAMNLAAFWILSFMFSPSAKQHCILLFLLSLLIGLGLFVSTLNSYVGLSGVLHGVFVFYALKEALNGRKSSWLLIIGIIAKITYEQLYGASESTAQLIAANVAIDAHLIGGIAGALLSLLLLYYSKRTANQV